MTISRALLTIAVLFSVGRPAHAETAEAAKEQATALFREGNELYSRGLFLDALQKYRQARALFPSHKIDLNIGGTLDALGRRTEAAIYFERFLIQSADAPAPIIAAARKRLEELRRKLASARITAVQDGAAVLLDGQVVGQTPLELPVYMEPGRHRLEARKEGHRAAVKELSLAAGQHTSVALLLDAQGEGALALDPTLAARRKTKTISGWAALGVGAACLVTAAVLYGVGGSQGSSAHDQYLAATDPVVIEARWQDVEAAKSKLVAGHVLAGLGAVAVGISIYQLVTRPAAEQRPRTALGVAPLAGGGAFSLRGSF